MLKTTIAAAALTLMVAAPAFASGDESFGIDDRYDLSTNYDLPQAQPTTYRMRPAAEMERSYTRSRDPVARQERHLNRVDQTGNR